MCATGQGREVTESNRPGDLLDNRMEKNYKSESKEGSGFFNDNEQNQRSNYNLFRSKYMHQNNEGIWIENAGMWKTVGGEIGEGKKGYRAPLTPSELKK